MLSGQAFVAGPSCAPSLEPWESAQTSPAAAATTISAPWKTSASAGVVVAPAFRPQTGRATVARVLDRKTPLSIVVTRR